MIKRVELIVQQSLFATINKKKLFLSQIEYEDYARDQTKELDRIVLKDHMNRLDEVRQLAYTDHHISGIEVAKKNNFRIGKSQNLTHGVPAAIKEEGNQTLSTQKKQPFSKLVPSANQNDWIYHPSEKNEAVESYRKKFNLDLGDLKEDERQTSAKAMMLKTSVSEDRPFKGGASGICNPLLKTLYNKGQKLGTCRSTNKMMSDRNSSKINFLLNLSQNSFLPDSKRSKNTNRGPKSPCKPKRSTGIMGGTIGGRFHASMPDGDSQESLKGMEIRYDSSMHAGGKNLPGISGQIRLVGSEENFGKSKEFIMATGNMKSKTLNDRDGDRSDQRLNSNKNPVKRGHARGDSIDEDKNLFMKKTQAGVVLPTEKIQRGSVDLSQKDKPLKAGEIYFKSHTVKVGEIVDHNDNKVDILLSEEGKDVPLTVGLVISPSAVTLDYDKPKYAKAEAYKPTTTVPIPFKFKNYEKYVSPRPETVDKFHPDFMLASTMKINAFRQDATVLTHKKNDFKFEVRQNFKTEIAKLEKTDKSFFVKTGQNFHKTLPIREDLRTQMMATNRSGQSWAKKTIADKFAIGSASRLDPGSSNVEDPLFLEGKIFNQSSKKMEHPMLRVPISESIHSSNFFS
jgi:hypothetical protein